MICILPQNSFQGTSAIFCVLLPGVLKIVYNSLQWIYFTIEYKFIKINSHVMNEYV